MSYQLLYDSTEDDHVHKRKRISQKIRFEGQMLIQSLK